MKRRGFYDKANSKTKNKFFIKSSGLFLSIFIVLFVISILVGIFLGFSLKLSQNGMTGKGILEIFDFLKPNQQPTNNQIILGVGGANYYVATNGSDSNNGSSDFPFLTIQHAADIVNPGDTVIIRNGTYTDSNNGNAVYINRGGTPGNYITFKAENKWGAILDGQNTTENGVWINDWKNYTIIEGLEIKNFTKWGISDAGSYIIIRQNKIHNIGRRQTTDISAGISVWDQSVFTQIDRNLIYSIGKLNPYTDPPAPEESCGGSSCYNHDHGIYAGSKYVNITNNVFYDHKSGWAVHLCEGTQEHIIIEGNTFADPNPQRNGQVIVCAPSDDIVIKGNIFYNPTNAMVQLTYGNNITNLVIKNNLGTVGQLVSDDNNVNYTSYDNYLNTDPLFVNAIIRNYHLQAGSPAIDNITSSNLTWDFDGISRPQGSVWDIGAYEYFLPPVAVFLVAPVNASGGTSRNVNFTFLPIDEVGFTNCTTLIWYSNGALLNDTNWNSSAIVNNSVNGINYTFAVDGSYTWNVLCWDSGGGNITASANRTLTTQGTEAIGYCGATLLSNIQYVLNQSVSATAACFNVTASNVTLDCNGFGINYSSASAGYGVVTTADHTTVKNCMFINQIGTSADGYAVYFNGASASNGTVYNNSIKTIGSSSHGIYLLTNANNNVTNNNVTTSGSGAYAFSSSSSTNSILTGNRFNTTSAVGVYVTGTTSTQYNQSIDTSNLAEDLPIWYNYSVSNSVILQNIDVSATLGQLICAWCTNVTYDNVTMGNDGFSLYGTNSSKITNSIVNTSNGYPILIYGGYFNNVSYDNFTTSGTIALKVVTLATTSSNTVANNQIYATANIESNYGVYLSGSNYNTFTSNNITVTQSVGSSGGGVYLGSGSSYLNFVDNSITISRGIAIDGTGGGASSNFSGNNIITTFGLGFWTRNSNVNVSDTNITTTSGDGVWLEYGYSNPYFSGVNVKTSSGKAVYVYNSHSSDSETFTFVNSVLNASDAGVADIYVRAGGFSLVGNFINCTFNKSDTYIDPTATNTSLNVFWYADAYVNDTAGNNVSSANVSVYDNAGILNNWSLTDANGLSSRLTLREYMQNATSSYFDTNYNFTGTKTSYDLNYSSINLTTNYITDGGSKIVLTLTASGGGADLSPVVTLNSPANGYSTNLTSITFNCSATDDKRILNLSLYTNASGTFSKNYTNTSCSSTTCYLSYTLTLQTNKTYLWNCLAYDNASQSSWAQQNWTLNIVQQDIISNCSDGTLYGECSSTKPLYCSNGNLVNNCSYCNCSSGTCQSDGSCKISDNGGGGGGGGAPENQTNATNDATNTTINGSDTSKDVCGDGVCSVTEKAGECCQDCGCQTGYECKENSCEVINPPDNTNHIKTWIWIGMIIVAILLLIYIIFAIAREKRGD